MLNTARIIAMIVLSTSFYNVYGQLDTIIKKNTIHLPEDLNGWWNFQVSGGSAFLSGDILSRPTEGFHAGLSLAKNLHFDRSQLLVPNISLSFAFAQMRGSEAMTFRGLQNNEALNGSRNDVEPLDYVSQPGYIYPNFQTQTFITGIELPVFLNPYKINSNIHIGASIGMDVAWYKSEYDQRDGNGLPYEYSNSFIFGSLEGVSESEREDLLEDAWDGDYDTAADGFGEKRFLNTIMPNFGLELGYRAVNNMTLSLSYKLKITRSDLFDGQQWNEQNASTGDNDIMHLAGISVKWDIFNRKHSNEIHPLFELVSPDTSHIRTNEPLAIIRNKLRNVKSINDISVTHNGANYTVYEFFNKEFATNVPLEPGENEIVVTASNHSGTDQVIYVFEYIPGENIDYSKIRPVLTFLNPSLEDQVICSIDHPLELEIHGIRDERDLRLFINQEEVKDFIYDEEEVYLKYPMQLKAGKNTIRAVAINKNGVSQILRNIYVINQPVAFNNIEPLKLNTNTGAVQQDLKLLIAGECTAEDIALSVNKAEVPFEFDESSRILSAVLPLDRGTNVANVAVSLSDSVYNHKYVIFQSEDHNLADSKESIQGEFSLSSFFNAEWQEETQRCLYNFELSYPDKAREEDIEIYLNNNPVTDYLHFEEDRIIRKALRLNQGNNYIKVRDDRGKIAVLDKVVECHSHFEPSHVENNRNPSISENQQEVNEEIRSNTDREPEILSTTSESISLPVIQINDLDGSNGIKTSEKILKIEGRVENLKDSEDLTLYFNGAIVENYKYDSKLHTFSVDLALSEIDNRLTLIAVNSIGVTDRLISIQYNKPLLPQIRLISPPDQAKFEQSDTDLIFNVSNADSSDVTITKNGARQENWIKHSDRINCPIILDEGVNKIVIKAGADPASQVGRTLYLYYTPIKKPEISIISPNQKGSEVDQSSYPFIATVRGVKSKDRIKLMLNDKRITAFNFENGALNTSLPLNIGNNEISVYAENTIGSTEASSFIRYNPRYAPQLELRSPSSDRLVTQTNPYILVATLNAFDPDNGKVSITLNNVEISDYSIEESDANKLKVRLPLLEGDNNIDVQIENEYGGDAISRTIIYKKPQFPVIRMISLENDLQIKKPEFSLRANVLHADEQNIHLFLNQQPLDFSLNSTSLSRVIQLQEGDNTIQITAENADGKQEIIRKITYIKPVPPPILTWIYPRESGALTDRGSHQISCRVEHVKNSDDISLTLNGNTSEFEFDPISKRLQSSVILLEGFNEITLLAKNDSGEAQAKTSMNYKKIEDQSSKKPSIRIVSTGEVKSDAFNPSLAQVAMVFEIENIQKKEQLILMVNDRIMDEFVYRTERKQLIATFPLEKGNNEIEIKASNAFGDGMLREVILYE